MTYTMNEISLTADMFARGKGKRLKSTTKITQEGCTYVVRDLMHKINLRSGNPLIWSNGDGSFDRLTNDCRSAIVIMAGGWTVYSFNFLDGVFHSISIWTDGYFGHSFDPVRSTVPTYTLDLTDLGTLSLYFLDEIVKVILNPTEGGLFPTFKDKHYVALISPADNKYALHYADLTKAQAIGKMTGVLPILG